MKKIFKKKCISDPIFSRYETGTTGIFFYALAPDCRVPQDIGCANVRKVEVRKTVPKCASRCSLGTKVATYMLKQLKFEV
jgi:hypothetical protein